MICEQRECFGCAACADICPKSAIYMTHDKGFWRPAIDDSKCVHCGLCKKVCSALTSADNRQNRFKKPECHAAWSKDKKRHFHSASGGLASELSEALIRRGGVVAGVCYDSQKNIIRHILVESLEDLTRLAKSKYVLSNKTGIYKEIKEKLNKGFMGLFIGVPCEVNALYRFLEMEGVGIENLYTVDLLCHGGASSGCLKEHIDYVRRGRGVSDITFRGGEHDCKFTVWSVDGKIIYQGNQYVDTYFKYFMKHSLFQEKCYSCPFANTERRGDLTIGDFWGVDEDVVKKNNVQGISLVLINSHKGRELYESIQSKIEHFERPVDEAIKGNDTFRGATEKPPEYEALWKVIHAKGFDAGLKEIYGTSERGSYLKSKYLYIQYKMIRPIMEIINIFRIVCGGGKCPIYPVYSCALVKCCEGDIMPLMHSIPVLERRM